jgi:large subunit ribosomal protein L15
MELHDLKPAEGSKKARRRVGRGSGSGLGKTSGRGHKGQGSRSGYTRNVALEGGQMPLHRRLPKRGFTNIFKTVYQIVNVSDLNRCNAGDITAETLKSFGLIKRTDVRVKVLGNGTAEKAFNVKASAFSKSAMEKLVAGGGKAEVV